MELTRNFVPMHRSQIGARASETSKKGERPTNEKRRNERRTNERTSLARFFLPARVKPAILGSDSDTSSVVRAAALIATMMTSPFSLSFVALARDERRENETLLHFAPFLSFSLFARSELYRTADASMKFDETLKIPASMSITLCDAEFRVTFKSNACVSFSRYQNELPKKIKSRGKDAHLTHEEIVQTIKWKLAVSILILF